MPPFEPRYDPASPEPAYRQIADGVRRAAAAGRIGPGETVPSTRVLAERLGVNPMTVSRAYRELVREGVLVYRRGARLTVSRRAGEVGEARRAAMCRRHLAEAARVADELGVNPNEVVRMLIDELAAREARRGRGR